MARYAPCESHPCECTGCVFSQKPSAQAGAVRIEETVRTAAQYGCVHGGAVVVAHDGNQTQLGLLREDGFRPVVPSGIAFMRKTGSKLLPHVRLVA